MLVSNSTGLYLVLFAVVMGVAALIALFMGGARAHSSPELPAKVVGEVQPADTADVSPQ